jgi:hypothetical protein
MFIKFSLKLFLAMFLLGFSAFSARAVNLVTVTNPGDPNGAGDCTSAGGDCSLRQAIATVSDSGLIIFNIQPLFCPNGVCTIILTQRTLNIIKSVTISGTSARNLIVQRSSAMGTPNFRVFTIDVSSPLSIDISNLTVSNGADQVVGGIYNSGPTSLKLIGVVITGIYSGNTTLIQSHFPSFKC